MEKAKNISLQEALKRFFREKDLEGVSPKTLVCYRETLKPMIAFVTERLKEEGLPPETYSLNENHIKAWMLWIKSRGYASSTVGIRFRGAKTFLIALALWGHIPEVDPKILFKGKIKKAETRQALSKEEMMLLMESKFLDTYTGKRDRFVIHAFLDSGMRRGELLGAKWNDVRTDDRGRTYLMLKMTKGGKPREVPLSPRTALALKEFKDALVKFGKVVKECDQILVGKKGPLGLTALGQMLQKRARKLGITSQVCPHVLRHTFVTNAFRKDMPLTMISKMVGHSSTTVTEQVYLHLNQDDVNDHFFKLHEGPDPSQ